MFKTQFQNQMKIRGAFQTFTTFSADDNGS
jgi:hypothetical protein